jgi:DNA-binding response OmpR family regulator
MPKVLVVDDDRAIQQLLEVNLELDGYDVAKAVDGAEALEMVASFAPDIVLLDVMMPRMDGREVCKRLKADPKTAALPIVFLSARAQEMDVSLGLELGAAAYLTKPFEPQDLLDTVRRVLAESKAKP